MTAYHQREPPPDIDADDAAELLEKGWGVVGSLSSLHADRDLNFAVLADDGRRFVLKLQNPADPPEVIDLQRAAMAHISLVAPRLPISTTVPTTEGASWLPATDRRGRGSHVRLFDHLEGSHPDLAAVDEATVHGWGRTFAELGRALRGFFHPAGGYDVQWDLRRTPRLRARLPEIDVARRAIVTEALDRYERNVEPVAPSLRAQMIHNDLSASNFLVDERGTISGILDFGDLTHTMLVNDLAIAVADNVGRSDEWLARALAMAAGYHAVAPLEDAEAAVLGDLVAARCAMTILLTLPDPNGTPDDDHAWRLLREMYDEGPDEVGRRLAEGLDASPAYAPRPTGDLLRDRSRTLGPLQLSYDTPLHITRGEGMYLIAANGERYLDAYNNVPVLGHSHPVVADAVATQLRRLNTNSRYLNEAGTELAERLLASAPGGLDRVLFVSSGSEANDVALRIARHATGARGAVVTEHAYHGVTEATFDLSPESWVPGHRPGAVRTLAPPRRDNADGGAAAERAIAELASAGAGLAAVVLDSAFISDGILGPAHEWIRAVSEAVHARGGLLVADEVQAGYGRTGEALWGISSSGAVPDFITLGKPMGNGFPVGAVLTRAELVDEFMVSTDFFSTFGGNTAACVAGLAVLSVVEDEGLIERARTVGDYLGAGLRQVAAAHASLGEVRSWGLLAGVDVVAPAGATTAAADAVQNRLKRLGVLVGTTGPRGDVLKIRPPLVAGREHVDILVERLALASEPPR